MSLHWTNGHPQVIPDLPRIYQGEAEALQMWLDLQRHRIEELARPEDTSRAPDLSQSMFNVFVNDLAM
jgi:hypothetical protein